MLNFCTTWTKLKKIDLTSRNYMINKMTTLFFDTETSGLPIDRRVPALQNEINWPQLVSLSWSVWVSEDCVKRVTYVIRPRGWVISDKSITVHGITQEFAEKNGSDLGEVLMEFRADIMRSDLIVAHNMEFDKNVVFHAFAWHLKKDPRRFWPEAAEFCSQTTAKGELKLPWAYAKANDPYKMPGLDEVYTATFNEPAPPAAHSSARDVEVLEKIYWARWSPSQSPAPQAMPAH
jgi:DNA polymerase III epsilon subunit-like protein